METASELQIHTADIKSAALLFRAVNHPLRQNILQLIHGAGKITVTTLYHKLRLEQSVTSQHLAILRKAGFVNTERSKRFIYYSINYNAIKFLEEESEKLLTQPE